MTISYILRKQTFYTWYFQNRSKEQIAGFLSPYLMNLVNKDAHFSLDDLLEEVKTVPAYLLENYPTSSKPNKEIEVKFVKLV